MSREELHANIARYFGAWLRAKGWSEPAICREIAAVLDWMWPL